MLDRELHSRLSWINMSRKECYHKQRNILREIVKASDSIRNKHKIMKLGHETAEIDLSNKLKPIVSPLEKIVSGFQSVKEIVPMKKEVKTEEMKNDYEEDEKHFNYTDSDDDDDDDYDDDDKSFKTANNPEDLETTITTSRNDIVHEYLSLLDERNKDMDNVYGVRKLSKNRLVIGDSPISFDESYINVGELELPATKGLLELLFKKVPKETYISEDDLENYEKIINITNAHRKHYNRDEAVRENKTIKFKNFISKISTTSSPKSVKKSRKSISLGKGMIPKYMIADRKEKRKVKITFTGIILMS